MFESLKNRGIMVDAMNSAGMYTQKQMDEKDERVKQLWNALNEAYATMDTYVWAIESMLDEHYSFCGKKWTEEMKKADIRNSCERLHEVADKSHKVLFNL